MLQRIQTVLVALGVGLWALASPSQAEAAPNVAIPCTSERAVKFADLKETGPRGERVDIGYLVSSCTTGTWVGYVEDADYTYAFTPERIADLKARGRIPAADPIPALVIFMHPVVFWREWIWIAAFLLFAMFRVGTMAFAGYLRSVAPEYSIALQGERRVGPAVGGVGMPAIDRRAPPLRPADRVGLQPAKPRARVSRSA